MSEPFLAEVRIIGFNFAPRGWAFCDGQILPINQNQSLYSLLGTTYGGDGRTSFALPDLLDQVVDTLGQLRDERVRCRTAQGVGDRGLVRRRIMKREVLAHGAGEEEGLLRHVGDGRPNAVRIEPGDVLAVEEHPARLRRLDPGREPSEGRLADARRADHERQRSGLECA